MNLNILKKKDFLLLMLGKCISQIGNDMQSFALSLYVLKITGSATKFASVLAVALIPQLILAPIAGVFVDWFDRKKMIVYLDIISGLVIGMAFIIFISKGELSLVNIYIIVIILSLTSVIFQPAISTVIPTIIEKEDLIDANGINSFIISIGKFISPIIAGILFGFFDLSIILLLNSISFIISSISEMFIKIPKINNKPKKLTFKLFKNDFMNDIKFIRNKKIIFNILIISIMLNFAGAPIFSVGITYISKRILQISDIQYGILESSFVVAMIISPFLCSIVSKKISLKKLLFIDVFVTSILIAILSIVSTSFYLNLFNSNFIPYISTMTIIFFIGIITTIGNIALNSIFQKEIPLEMMGRVGTVMSTVSMGLIPLSRMLFGVLFDIIPAYICVLICSILLLVTIMVFRKNLYNIEEKTNKCNYKSSISS